MKMARYPWKRRAGSFENSLTPLPGENVSLLEAEGRVPV